ncbi:hypothetical protein LJR219_003040 [Phenylobacterium sp. LjRoot219]|uniref:hypothetical protein n=1 Tax=Phenylobacterium sp. LjRoot219 TaxID=3342283 RepID=UPI003ECD201E
MRAGADRVAGMRKVQAPPPATLVSAPSYLTQAEACLTAAATSPDPAARALHEEECKLWLMLARHRTAIDDVVRSHLEPA